MNSLFEIMNLPANTIFDQANELLTALSDFGLFPAAGSGLAFAFAPGVPGRSNIPESVLASVRRWHDSIDDRFSNIDNVVRMAEAHQQTWAMPPELLTQLTGNRNRLQELISLCRTNAGSPADRTQRNTLLASTVGLCLLQVRVWAYGQYTAGILTADDVHLLGFLLPGEIGGRRGRMEATDILAEVKVTVINADFIRAVVDQSAGENAAQVAHGWPPGVRQVLIVITAADGVTEVYRQMSTRLHNDIPMPKGSHGQQYLIKAAFLRHIDDEPRFGNEPTFSMPLTTEDLAATLDRQHHEDFDAQMQEIERHRQEIERIQAELNAKKKDR
ncbi:MAG: hypothetical protein LBJ01_00825 [Tannerella sp.]|jgi:hypothetical protein|nr:hypothetical protein [Tannerella sp.]